MKLTGRDLTNLTRYLHASGFRIYRVGLGMPSVAFRLQSGGGMETLSLLYIVCRRRRSDDVGGRCYYGRETACRIDELAITKRTKKGNMTKKIRHLWWSFLLDETFPAELSL